jgi:ABC-type lipoprotein release transport system permease subunit
MFRIAWRNLWRNRARTLISITAIALSYAMFLISIGFADSMYDDMEVAAAEMVGGNVLIHGKGYWESQTNEKFISDPAPILASVAQTKDIKAVASRVITEGLLSTSASSSATRLMGVDPLVEKDFSNPAKYLDHGKFFDEAEEAPLVIGAKTAKTLNVDVGDRVVLTVTAPDGEMQRALFYVTGILKAGVSSIDDGPAYTTISAAQNALGIGAGLTQVGLLTETVNQAGVKTEVAKLMPPELEILTWDEAMPDLVGMIELDAAFGDIYGIIIFIVVVFAVMNTFLMIVMERIRELGLLAALGLKPSQVARLLLIESFLMAVVSVIIGFGLGYLGHTLINAIGIDMNDLYGTDIEMGGITMVDTILHSKINPPRWIKATISVLGLVMLGAVYPAYKASKLNPSQAMRFFQ